MEDILHCFDVIAGNVTETVLAPNKAEAIKKFKSMTTIQGNVIRIPDEEIKVDYLFQYKKP